MKTVIAKYASIITEVNGNQIQFRNHRADVDLATALILSSRPGYSLSQTDKYKDAASVLLARNMGIGDVLFCSTIPAYIKKVNPKARITFLTFPRHYTLLERHPYIDELADIVKLNQIDYIEAFDYIINLNNFFESGQRLVVQHEVHRVDMLRKQYDALEKDWDYTIYLNITDEYKLYAEQLLKPFRDKKIIVVATQASELTRRYPDNPKLIKFLAEHNYSVVVVSPGDDTKYNHPNILDMSGKTDLKQLSAIIEAADLVITPDSGPLHIAGSLDKKIITFFNSFPPEVRTKYYKNCFAFDVSGRCPKNLYPCGYQNCTAPCLKTITPPQFLRKIQEML